MSLLLVALMAFTMLPTAALAADTSEEHVHTKDCVHEEIAVEIESVTVDTSAVEADPTTEITVETEEATITETEPVTEETADSNAPYSGMIGESSVAWKVDPSTGRLTISGSGDCEDFTISHGRRSVQRSPKCGSMIWTYWRFPISPSGLTAAPL